MRDETSSGLVERLLEHVQGAGDRDEPLVELIETLNQEGRQDLLMLIDDFLQLRPDAAIHARVGSPEDVERNLVELHAVFEPIAQRDYTARIRPGEARAFYTRMGYRDRKTIGVLVGDPDWSIDKKTREQLEVLFAAAGERPPVAFESLREKLGLPSDEVVVDLILLLRDRKNEVRRRKDQNEGRNRS